jgi:hypothetical protein
VSADISLSDILGTEKGISALIDFLDITGAFTRDGMKRNPPQDPEYKPRSVWDDFDDITNTQAAEGDPTEADWRDEIVDPDDFENDI